MNPASVRPRTITVARSSGSAAPTATLRRSHADGAPAPLPTLWEGSGWPSSWLPSTGMAPVAVPQLGAWSGSGRIVGLPDGSGPRGDGWAVAPRSPRYSTHPSRRRSCACAHRSRIRGRAPPPPDLTSTR